MLKNIINILNVGLELLKNVLNSISRRLRTKDIENQQEENKQLDTQIDNNLKNKDVDGLNEMLGFKKPSAKKATAKKATAKTAKDVASEPKKRSRKKKSEQ